MMALMLASALATESSEPSPPHPAHAVATASLVVADVYAVSALAPIRALTASPARDAGPAIIGEVVLQDHVAPGLLRISGRPAQVYRVRLNQPRNAEWVFEDLSVISEAVGDVTTSGMAMLDSGGGDVLRITGTFRPRNPAADEPWPQLITASFGIDYE